MRGGRIHRIELAVAVAVLLAMITIGDGTPSSPPSDEAHVARASFATFVEPIIEPQQDTSPPNTTIQLLGDMGTAGWFISAVTVVLLAEDDTGAASTSYRINDGPAQGYGGPFSIEPDGVYTLEYFSVDIEGNTEIPKSAAVWVDKTPPSIVEISPTELLTRSEVTLSWFATDATSGVASYDISIDSGPFEPQGRLESRTISLPDGQHTIRVRAWDVAGLSSESEASFRIDTSPLSITGPRSSLVYILIFGANVAVVTFVWFVRRRRRK